MRWTNADGTVNVKGISAGTVFLVLALVIALWSIVPIAWMIITGLKELLEVYSYPPTFFPKVLSFENLRYIFIERPFAFYLRNSAIVALATVLISTTFATLAGYSFAKFQFKGKGIWLLLILLTRTVPPASLLVPFYAIGNWLGIITFMLSWNELLYGVVLTNTKAAKTLSPGLTDFFGDFHIFWNQLSAAAVVSILPAIIFTLFFSRYLVSGLVKGAIKE
jgi:ABC-type glycerol-3-phosphate transport system permease component